jgi:hypothetical protein
MPEQRKLAARLQAATWVPAGLGAGDLRQPMSGDGKLSLD